MLQLAFAQAYRFLATPDRRCAELDVIEFAPAVLDALLGIGDGGLASVELRPVKTGFAHLQIPARFQEPGTALGWFEGLLKVEDEAPRMAATEA